LCKNKEHTTEYLDYFLLSFRAFSPYLQKTKKLPVDFIHQGLYTIRKSRRFRKKGEIDMFNASYLYASINSYFLFSKVRFAGHLCYT